jgi:hypothetical protein
MLQQDNGILYTYSWLEKMTQYVVVLFSGVVVLTVTAILITVLFSSLIQAISGIAVDPLLIGVCLLAPPILALFPLYFSNMHPSIRIYDNGISVQVFLLWWRFIPWEDIEEVRSIPLSRSRLVIVQRLTPIHRLFCSSITWRFRPAFLLKHTLKGFNEAVRTIEEKVGKR